MTQANSHFQATHLACERGDRRLFVDLSFSVSRGEVIQVVGANGSGKTSLLRLLSGLAEPANGEVHWQGERISEARDAFHQDLIYIGHRTGVKAHLSVQENLENFASMHNAKQCDIDNALRQLQLTQYRDEFVDNLSAGQQRRVALARLPLLDKKCWILDEPLTAMDTDGIKIFESILIHHCQYGGMAIFTSHQAVNLDGITIRRLSLDTQSSVVA